MPDYLAGEGVQEVADSSLGEGRSAHDDLPSGGQAGGGAADHQSSAQQAHSGSEKRLAVGAGGSDGEEKERGGPMEIVPVGDSDSASEFSDGSATTDGDLEREVEAKAAELEEQLMALGSVTDRLTLGAAEEVVGRMGSSGLGGKGGGSTGGVSGQGTGLEGASTSDFAASQSQY